MKTKKPTSTDVAKLAGVSQASVSLILNRSSKTDFSEETKNRVYEAAKALGYKVPVHKNIKNSSKSILVFIPTLTNQYYCELSQTLEEYADSLGYKIIVCNTFRNPELEHFYLDKFASEKISGIIYTFLPSFTEEVNRISMQIPVVLIGEKTDSLSICSIELTNHKAGKMIAEYLYENGHRHIAFISTPMNQITLSRRQRFEGLQEGLYALGKRDGQDVSINALSANDSKDIDNYNNGLSYEFIVGKAQTEIFLSKRTNETALVGANDMIALGILNALQLKGINVPTEFSVCGFDNIFSAAIANPGLTTIDHKLLARSHSAIDTIVAQDTADGTARNSELIANKIEFSPTLVIRSSTTKI